MSFEIGQSCMLFSHGGTKMGLECDCCRFRRATQQEVDDKEMFCKEWFDLWHAQIELNKPICSQHHHLALAQKIEQFTVRASFRRNDMKIVLVARVDPPLTHQDIGAAHRRDPVAFVPADPADALA